MNRKAEIKHDVNHEHKRLIVNMYAYIYYLNALYTRWVIMK